jgi:hypothetical protein
VSAAARPAAAKAAATGDIHARIQGTNINPRTLLATDYLNHFNEVLMLIELVPDDPDCLAEVVNWRPVTYREHFAKSGLSEGAIAVEAYDAADAAVRQAFDGTTERLNGAIRAAIYRLSMAVEGDDPERLRHVAGEAAASLRSLADEMNRIIHGAEATLDQSKIDQVLDQDAIDKMF